MRLPCIRRIQMVAPPLPAAAAVIDLHDQLLGRSEWPSAMPNTLQTHWPQDSALLHWLLKNHRCNCLLWAEEDLARRTTVSDAEIAANKRAIDSFNQARNDATERIDELLLLALGLVDETTARGDAPQSRAAAGARLNSETAGSMIDRLSIMALKIHAMQLQSQRSDVDQAHLDSALSKLNRLRQQRGDLADCLDSLLLESAAGRAYFKVYRQFKMYNDPRLNPELVKERQAH